MYLIRDLVNNFPVLMFLQLLKMINFGCSSFAYLFKLILSKFSTSSFIDLSTIFTFDLVFQFIITTFLQMYITSWVCIHTGTRHSNTIAFLVWLSSFGLTPCHDI